MDLGIYKGHLSKCVHCGRCKARCPTYLITLNESMSARGRMVLLHELQGERLSPTPGLAERIFSCMLCEACSGVCPAGLDIPSLIYRGRSLLRGSMKRGMILKTITKLALLHPDTTMPFIRIIQGLMTHIISRFSDIDRFPMIAKRPFKDEVRVLRNSKSRGRVAIFSGCNVNYLFPDLGRRLVGLIMAAGYEVVVFRGEVCCGEPFRSLGLDKEAETLAKKNTDHFSRVHALAIVSLCPTCTTVMKKYYPEITGKVIQNVMDVNEFIKEFIPLDGLRLPDERVTYHDPCHMRYVLEITNLPREILSKIAGIELIEMKHPENCCGFAGLFSVRYRDISKKITEAKINDIISTSASTVVTSCPGCMMHLNMTLKRIKRDIRVKHIIHLLSDALINTK